VQADLVGRDVAQRVIERLDVALGDFEELRVAQLGKRQVTTHRQVGAVDLQHEPRAVDGVVLLLHDVDEPGQVRLAARVVLVAHEVGDDARRGRRHERLGGLHVLQGRLQVGDVLLHGAPVLPLDGTVAGRPQDGRAPLGPRGRLREVRPVGPRRHRRLPAEAGQPVAHVGGVTDLALLAVADDVHAGLDLLADDVGHGALHARSEGDRVGLGARVERLQRRGEVRGTGQAAGVRGEDPVRASLHRVIPPRASWLRMVSCGGLWSRS
jgi:hypothetical protein